MRASRRAELALVVVAAAWGLSFPVIKIAVRDAPPFTFLALRFGLGLLLLFPILGWRRPSRRAWVPGLLLAAALGGSYLAQTAGLIHTTPTKSAFITGLSVVLVPLLYPIITRRFPRPWPLFGVVLATAGLYLLTDPRGEAFNRGDVLTLGCATGYALYVILLEVFSRKLPYRDLLRVQMIALAVFFVPFAVAEGGPYRWNGSLILAVSVAAIILVITLYLQNRFQRNTTATKAAVIYAAEPVFAAVFSFFLFGDMLQAGQWAGGGLILAGILAAERR